MLLESTRMDLPRLAWIAMTRSGSGRTLLAHGPDVEVSESWAAEGVWDAGFDQEGFQSSQNLYGSGVWVSQDAATFRTATTLVDRLWVATRAGEVKVSNSLPLILAATDSGLLADHDYSTEMAAITAGVNKYKPAFPVAGEWSIEQRFYSTIRVTKDAKVEVELYSRPATFASFDGYRDHLFTVADALCTNLESIQRQSRVVSSVALSNGYDSTLAAVLARRAGATHAYTRRRATAMVPAALANSRSLDDGTPAAKALGLEVVDIGDRPTATWDPTLELAFLAGSPLAREGVFLPMAVDVSAGPVVALFNGYHGDRVWERKLPESYMTDLWRSDYSGITMGEARLHAGYFMVSVAFAGAEGIRSINQISNSDDMRPWSVAEDYDRPIPRRIIEEAGIPRGSFGLRKKAVWSVIDSAEPAHPTLRSQVSQDPKANVVPRVRGARTRWRLRSLARLASTRAGKSWPASVLPPGQDARSAAVHHWAVGEMTRRYARQLRIIEGG